jgi:hypothetical protein
VEIPDLAKKVEQNPNFIKNARLRLDCQLIEDLPADCVIDNKLVYTVTRDIIERVTPRTKVVPLNISRGGQNNFHDPEPCPTSVDH